MKLLDNLRSQLSSPRHSKSSTVGAPRQRAWDLLFDSPDFLVAEIDRSGLIREANPEFCRLRNADASDVVGSSLAYLVNAEERSALSHLIGQTFAGLPGGTVMARLLTDGDAMPPVQWALLAVRNAAGEIGTAICVGTDLSEFVQPAGDTTVEEEIEAFRRKLENLREENESLRYDLEHRPATSLPDGTPLVIPGVIDAEGGDSPTLADLERRYILHTLETTKGRISGPKGAAAILGLHPNTLRSRMEKLGIVRVA